MVLSNLREGKIMASNRTLDQISIIRKKEDHSMAHIADTTFKS